MVLFKHWQRISASYDEHKHMHSSHFCFERSKTDNKAQHSLVETALPRGFKNQLPFGMLLPAVLQRAPGGTHALPGLKRSYLDISAFTEKKQFHGKTMFSQQNKKTVITS